MANNGPPINWQEAPDFMDIACIVTIWGVCKCWRVPAVFGITGILCASLCWEQRALGRRDIAKSAGGSSLLWSLIGIGVGVYYYVKNP